MTLERQPGKHLGIRISGSCPEPGIFIVEILEDSITALDGRIKVLSCAILLRCQTSPDHLQAYDRLLFINGTDVRHCKISQASDLIKVVVIVLLIIVDHVTLSCYHCVNLSCESSTKKIYFHIKTTVLSEASLFIF